MSNMSLLAEKLLGGFAYAVESGKTVDGDTVSASYFPDNDPTSNWPSAGDILAVRFSASRQTDPVMIPQAAGGYVEDPRETVTADFVDLVLRNFNEWIHRIMFGLSAEIALDTPQTIWDDPERYILGVLKLQGRQQDGTDLVRFDCYGKFTLGQIPEWTEKYGQPVLRFQKLYSALNSIEFPSS